MLLGRYRGIGIPLSEESLKIECCQALIESVGRDVVTSDGFYSYLREAHLKSWQENASV